MNIGEILRAAGYEIARAPGLEWQADVVEKLAGKLAALPPSGAEEDAALNKAANFLYKNVTQDLLHIRWALRDALHRSQLRRNSPGLRALTDFGINLSHSQAV